MGGVGSGVGAGVGPLFVSVPIPPEQKASPTSNDDRDARRHADDENEEDSNNDGDDDRSGQQKRWRQDRGRRFHQDDPQQQHHHQQQRNTYSDAHALHSYSLSTLSSSSSSSSSLSSSLSGRNLVTRTEGASSARIRLESSPRVAFASHLRRLSRDQTESEREAKRRRHGTNGDGGGGGGRIRNDILGGSHGRRRRRISRAEAARIAEEELRLMERLWYDEHGTKDKIKGNDKNKDERNDNDNHKERTRSYPSTYYSNSGIHHHGLCWDGPIVRPDVDAYTAVVDAHAKSGTGRAGAERAESVLNRLVQLWNDERGRVRPQTIKESVGEGVGEGRGRGHGAERDARGQDDEVDYRRYLMPNAILYTGVINAWSRAGDGSRAQAVLERMGWNASSILEGGGGGGEGRDKNDDDDDDDAESMEFVQPDVVACSSVVDAWANTRPHYHKGDGDNGDDPVSRAEAIVRTMEEHGPHPNAYTYTALMKVYSTHMPGRRGAEMAESVLRKMVDSYYESATTGEGMTTTTTTNAKAATENEKREIAETIKHENSSSFTTASSSSSPSRAPYIVKPNAYAYTAAMNAWSKSKCGMDGARRVESLLEELIDMYVSAGMSDDDLKPTAEPYTCLMDAYARSGGGADASNLALSLLTTMEEGGTMIVRLQRQRRRQGEEEEEEEGGQDGNDGGDGGGIKDKMDGEEKGQGRINVFIAPRPNARTYTAAIAAASRSGREDAPDVARDILLRRMNASMRDARAYACVIHALAKSGRDGCASKADELLMELVDLSKRRRYARGERGGGGEGGVGGEGASGRVAAKTMTRIRTLDLTPDEATHAAVIHAYRRSENGTEDYKKSPERCVAILRQLVELRLRNPGGAEVRRRRGGGGGGGGANGVVDRWLFNDVLRIVARSGRPDAPDMCEGVLDLMEGLADGTLGNLVGSEDEEDERDDVVVPGGGDVTRAGAKRTSHKGRTKGGRPHRWHTPRWEEAGPNSASYTFAMDACVNSAAYLGADVADRALSILRRCEERHATESNTKRKRGGLGPSAAEPHRSSSLSSSSPPPNCAAPDARSVSSALEAQLRGCDASVRAGNYAASRRFADEASALLMRMVRLNDGGDDSYRAGVRLFARMMTALLRSRGGGDEADADDADSDADTGGDRKDNGESSWIQKVLDLFRYMREKSRTDGNDLLKPNTVVYNIVIDSLSKSRAKGSAAEAERLLRYMERRYAEGDADVKPDVVTYGAVVSAWAGSPTSGSSAKAERHLATLEGAYAAGDVYMKPNAIVYNGVATCLARSNQRGAVDRADKLLAKMERLYRVGGDAAMRPDLRTYTSVVAAHARSRKFGGAERAEKMLRAAERAAASSVSAAKGKSGGRDSGPFMPDVALYTAVIHAHAKERAPGSMDKAEVLAEKMMTAYKRGGRDELKPNRKLMNTLIHGWATSNYMNKAEKAQSVLRRMREMNEAGEEGVRPDVFAYTWVIYAAATSLGTEDEKKHFFAIALDTFQEVHRRAKEDEEENTRIRGTGCDVNEEGRPVVAGTSNADRTRGINSPLAVSPARDKYLTPDSYIYSFFLKACLRLLPEDDEREELVKGAFDMARRSGMVNKHVLSVALKAVPGRVKELFREAGNETVEFASIPEAWCRNVRDWGKGRAKSVLDLDALR